MPASPAGRLDVSFASLKDDTEEVVGLLAVDGPEFGATGKAMDESGDGILSRAAKAAEFKGKAKSSAEILAPAGIAASRLILVGGGDAEKAEENDWVMAGGAALAKLDTHKAKSASLVVEVAGESRLAQHEIAAAMALGAYLRSYKFEKYQTKKKEDNEDEPKPNGLKKLVVHCLDPKKAEKAFERQKAIGDGVMLARDLVNEPANILGPVEFAERAQALEKVGIEVEVLDAKDLKKLKMGALLAVAQGSPRPARVVVMHWNGGKKNHSPVAFVGKGVVFDTGGISIKPAAGMEDMKGDMGGAACVVGLMHVLAARKAKVNAVGIIGCVENMPSGEATRPGDIVTSMSGQTIEVLNTDAEGRLVLSDIMWYVQERYKPKMMIDLATLTGAIMVALGKNFAGLFCNNDDLATSILEASKVTDEKAWRMPLDKSFHKMIDSKNADVKNLGGRWGGACTAAAFLERFVKDKETPWAHIDLAGTAMDAPRNDINQSWGSGWGVRLLDRLVAEKYEG
ncbi:MAG: aminopeptidase [Alphaproteobacteria bacterium BRH_c36]|nr:MAG: aminopeptidase [Alphaproteobacteria bacterium BRH_c36]